VQALWVQKWHSSKINKCYFFLQHNSFCMKCYKKCELIDRKETRDSKYSTIACQTYAKTWFLHELHCRKYFSALFQIQSGTIRILFASPESVLPGTSWGKILHGVQQQICAMFVDESHIVKKWYVIICMESKKKCSYR